MGVGWRAPHCSLVAGSRKAVVFSRDFGHLGGAASLSSYEEGVD